MLESPLDSKEIKPVNPKGNQPWIFFGRTDAEAEAEALILWPPHAKNQLIGKDPDAWKDWRQEEKGATEDEMVGWHHQLNEQEFEQTPGDSEEQGSWCASVHEVTESQTWLIHKTTSSTLKKRSASFTGWAIWSPSLSVFFQFYHWPKFSVQSAPQSWVKQGSWSACF